MSTDIKEKTLEEDLDFTQGVRKKLIEKMADGAISSKDPDQLNAVLKAADGMDKNVFGRMKIAEKKRENATAEVEAEAMAKYLIGLSENRAGNAPPPVRPGSASDVAGRALPADQKPTYDPSLADPKGSNETSEEFAARMEANKPKR